MQPADARATNASKGKPRIPFVHHGVSHQNCSARGAGHDVINNCRWSEDVQGQGLPQPILIKLSKSHFKMN